MRLSLKTTSGEMELRWKFEQGGWRVAGGDLIDVEAVMDAEAREEEQLRRSAAAKTKPSKTAAKGGK